MVSNSASAVEATIVFMGGSSEGSIVDLPWQENSANCQGGSAVRALARENSGKPSGSEYVEHVQQDDHHKRHAHSHKIIPRIEVSLSVSVAVGQSSARGLTIGALSQKEQKRSDRREGDKAERDQARLEMRWLTSMSDFL